MVDYKELVGGGGDELSLAHSDPIVLEFNRLQNQLKGLSLSLYLSFSLPLSLGFFFLAFCIESTRVCFELVF